jgi:hypothetical protein
MGGDDIACELRGDDVPFVSHMTVVYDDYLGICNLLF